MRVSRNEKLIKQRSRLGTYATFAGLAVLIGGFILSLQSTKYLTLSLAALVIGFLLSQYGSYNLRRWSRSPRPDQVVENALKGFDDRYHLYSWSLPVPHVLLSPQGVYTFDTRDQTGAISVKGDQWRTKMNLSRVLLAFGQEGLGNPSREARDNAARLQKFIQAELPDNQIQVQPAVVFIDERAQLTVNEPSVPVMDADSVKKWLRGTGKGETLKNADYRALETLFDARATGVGASTVERKRSRRV